MHVSRLATLLLVLAVAVVALLAVQFGRALRLEDRAREVELERARLAAERLLATAIADERVFSLLPASRQVAFVRGVSGFEPVIDPEVGWLAFDADAAPDLIVADRLDRAARAEFVAGDAAAAAREYDELLAGALRAVDRMVALSAAMWQAERQGDGSRCERLLQQGEQLAGELPPAASGLGFVAQAIAGTARLRARRGGPAPEWWATVLPRLPALAECSGALEAAARADLAARTAGVRARRAVLAEAASRTGMLDGERAGVAAAAPGQLFWWQPRADGTCVASTLGLQELVALVRGAAASNLTEPWPWLLDAPQLQDGAAFAGIPGLRGFAPLDRPLLDMGGFLLPAATAVLLLALALLLWQQLRAARAEALAARRQGEFLTTVTHELKTPLASIRLLSELLADGRAPGKEQEYYGLLALESGRLSMLVENVLDLGRAERGERAFDLRPLDLGDVVRETLAAIAPLCERDGLAVELREHIAMAPVRGDRAALAQVLHNVLDNARKYAAAGRRLEVALANGQPSRLQVRIRDHGPGVPADEREAIFERFARGKSQQHGSVAGVGIGLYLARSIARRHGGELACEPPAAGAGAEFVLTLPKAAEATEAAE